MADRYRNVWLREYRGKRGTTFGVCYYDAQAEARRTKRTFHSKREAQAFRDEYQLFLNGEGPNPEAPSNGRRARVQPRLWSEATKQWIDSGATRDTTRSTYRSLLGEFSKRASITCVEEVTESTVSKFLSGAKRRGRSLATCAAYLRTLAAFFTWARPSDSPITPRLISRWNPYKDRKRARPRYFTHDDYEAMLAASDTITTRLTDHRSPLWWKCFISLLYYGGFRLNETAHLIWRDIDFEKGIIRIQPHVGLKGVFKWQPKGKICRAVPVPSQVTDLLVHIHEAQQEGTPYVFITSRRYATLIKKGEPKRELLWGITKGFKHIRDLAGISEGTPHDMRRTCITNWASQPSLKPKDVQVLAGHDDLNTTLDIYTMVEAEDVVQKAMKILKNQNALRLTLSQGS